MKYATFLLATFAAFIVTHRAFELGLWPSLYCAGVGLGFGIVILLVTQPANLKGVK